MSKWLARQLQRTKAQVDKWPAYMQEILEEEKGKGNMNKIVNSMQPCPCCGGSATLCHDPLMVTEQQNWIRCNTCRLRTGYYATQEEAIVAWNRRTRMLSDSLLDEYVRQAADYDGAWLVEELVEKIRSVPVQKDTRLLASQAEYHLLYEACEELSTELTTLRAQLIATQDSREKAETEMDRLNEIVGRQHAELTRLRPRKTNYRRLRRLEKAVKQVIYHADFTNLGRHWFLREHATQEQVDAIGQLLRQENE